MTVKFHFIIMHMQITAQDVLSNQLLKNEWETIVSSTAVASSPKATNSSRQALMLKMLHTQFKEFAINTRTLETLDEGKSADVDVSLRAKLKTHAAEKHLHLK